MLFNLTPKLRQFIARKRYVAPGSDDDDLRKILGEMLTDGEVDMKTLRELGQPVITSFSPKIITRGLRAVLVSHYGMSANATDTEAAAHLLKCYQESAIELSTIRAIVQQDPESPFYKAAAAGAPAAPSPPADIAAFPPSIITKGMRHVLEQIYGMAPSASDEQAAEYLYQLFDRKQIDLPTIAGIVEKTIPAQAKTNQTTTQ